MQEETVLINGLEFKLCWGVYSISKKDLQAFCKAHSISASQLKTLVSHALTPFLAPSSMYMCYHKEFILKFLRIIESPIKAQKERAIEIFQRSKAAWLRVLGEPKVYIESIGKYLTGREGEKHLARVRKPEKKEEAKVALDVYWRNRETYDKAAKAAFKPNAYQIKRQMLIEASLKYRWLNLKTLGKGEKK